MASRPRTQDPRVVDWSALITLARRHRLIPLLYQWLADCETVAPEIREALRVEAHFLVGNNLRLTRELVQVGNHLKQARIPFLPLKGPVLAHTLYDGLGKRPFGDLDILIPPQHLWAGMRLLQSLGYESEFDWPAWRHRAYALSSGHHYALFHPTRKVGVELHWRISPGKLSFRLETPAFWERVQTTPMVGTALPSSPPEDLLLILCVHGARHWWSQLNLIMDVALLLKRYPSLDWSAVTERARAAGALRTLYLGLLMAHRVLGAELPPELEKNICADRAVRDLANDSWSLLVLQTDLEEEHWQRWRYFLRLRERPADRLIYAGGQGINSLFWRHTSWAMNRQRAKQGALVAPRAEMVAE